MKKLIFLLILSINFIAHAQDNIESSKLLDNQKKMNHLPERAQNYIRLNYPNDSILKAGYRKLLWSKTYEVHYDLWIIEFDTNGNWTKNYTLDGVASLDTLPEGIKKTIIKNYPKQKIVRIEQTKSNLHVYLDNNKNLSFKNKL